MVDFLSTLVTLGLLVQAAVGLSYLISSIWEKEKRATLFAAIQFVGMLGLLALFVCWWIGGFFKSSLGIGVLICFLIGGAAVTVMLIRKTTANQKALQGTKGAIVGDVERVDERDIVFARNRSLQPGSEQYQTYYAMRPENEEFDTARREKGGPLGHPGAIDKPEDRPNVAATLASLAIPLHLSTSEKYYPSTHPEFKGQRIEISPEEASQRIKGYTLNIGANLVGIAEINPLWVYSMRGEIFHENWEDWGKEIEA
ncbi:MAG: hypothetical protein PVG87_27505, partial [Desulfobacteraceae bacterium]